MEVTAKTKRLAVIGGIVVTVLGAYLSTGATAFFTANGVIGTNTFTAGSLDIALTPEGPAATAISYANMVPGDSVTQPVTISNVGSVNFRYSMTSVATNPDGRALKDQLVFTIKTADTGEVVHHSPGPRCTPATLTPQRARSLATQQREPNQAIEPSTHLWPKRCASVAPSQPPLATFTNQRLPRPRLPSTPSRLPTTRNRTYPVGTDIARSQAPIA